LAKLIKECGKKEKTGDQELFLVWVGTKKKAGRILQVGTYGTFEKFGGRKKTR